MNYAHQVVSAARNAFESGVTRPIEWRIKQLRRLHDMFTEYEDKFTDALYADLRKSKHEAMITELIVVKNEIVHAIKNVHSWAKPTYASKSLLQQIDSMYLQKEPLGVILNISAWNYPIQLSFLPLVAAIASGNCAILKPSEMSENTAKVIADIVPQYLDKECYPVYNGGIPETTSLLQERFDHILYTGATHVGKIVMTAAAKHLTPVTLELGGKCPAYVDKNVHMKIVLNRLLWGKLLNCGQTCTAPDYVLCHESVLDEFIAEAKNVLNEMLGNNPKESPDLGRIVSTRNFTRLSNIIEAMPEDKLVVGGDVDAETRYIGPTIYKNVSMEDQVMQSEIFGPILPVVVVSGEDEAIKIINGQEKPLALYIFSNTIQVVNEMLEKTSSGGVTVNDILMHCASHNLPFGGVGNSGTGRYHGKWGFDTFTHEKSISWRKQNLESLLAIRYMPYEGKLRMAMPLLVEKERGYCNVM